MVRRNLKFRIVDFDTFRIQVAGYIPDEPVGQGFQICCCFRTCVKIVRNLFAGDDDIRIVFRHFFRQQAFLAGRGQFRQGSLDLVDPGLVQIHRNQVRFREVTVVVGFFLGTHGQGHPVSVIPGTGLLYNMTAVFHDFDLAFHFVFDGPFQGTERVQVFDFRTGTEFRSPFRHDGNIGVAAETAFLHLAVADISVFQDGFQLFHVGSGFRRAAHIRFGYDFDQGHACTVIVNGRRIGSADGQAAVHQLAGIFFHMDTGNTDAFFLTVHPDVDMSSQTDRLIPLGDLVVLCQIRVEIILAVHFIEFLDIAV